ncbi:MAG: hypothetical protein EBR02_09325 [Alphaproteobacteria bacterium]|nr:hypothetical protein [Alphaproteobacteria bacterium]
MNVGSALSAIVARNPQVASLSAGQRQTLNDIVSQYDASHFTKSDFERLGSELRAAGIRPSAEVKNALSAKGINVEQFGPPAGGPPAGGPPAGGRPPGGPPPGGPPGGGPGGGPPPKKPDSSSTSSSSSTLADYYKTDETISEYIASFLKKMTSSDVSTDDTKTLLDFLKSSGVKATGLVIDETA